MCREDLRVLNAVCLVSANEMFDVTATPAAVVRGVLRHKVDNRQISAYKCSVRRKPGTLVPLEVSILTAAADLLADNTQSFHGFQMARHVSDGADQRRLTAYGTLYRALGRLEKLGLLQSRWEDAQAAADERRPVRRLYTLTPAGVTAVAVASPRRASGARPPRRRKVAPA